LWVDPQSVSILSNRAKAQELTMGRFIAAIKAMKADVLGICQGMNVVSARIVTRPTQGTAALLQLRSLLARLLGREPSGRWALEACQARPEHVRVDHRAGCASSRRSGRRTYQRPSRPGPGYSSGRF
jgi:hypothetical protein